jgi:amino acid adenylation domain-containing protein
MTDRTTTATMPLQGAYTPLPRLCTHELFEQQVARDPSAIALSAGNERMTYGELDARANQLAHLLRRRGVGPDSLVGVAMHRSPRMVTALLGIWKAGGAYVPIDPAYPAERMRFMVDDAAVQTLLTDEATTALFPDLGERVVCLDARWTAIADERHERAASTATPENLAYVIYTSGSTGRPKGALIQHDGLVNYLSWAIECYAVRQGDVVPVHSSISFDLTVTSLYPALLSGGQIELVPEDVGAQSLIASLQDGRCRGLVKITPAHLELLTQQTSEPAARNMTRVFVIGGENLTAESLRFWRTRAPDIRLINEYGPTETVVGCCVHEVRPDDPHTGSIPIGRPIANTQLYVLDDALRPVPLGEKGELYIGGAGVARGYLNRPELTRERFLPDPFSGRPDARLYKTGDIARYRPDGILEYFGRSDDQIKIRGYRIELGEIETVLGGHPEVRGAAVVARESSPGNKRLVAYVVPQQPGTPSIDAMRTFLGERLPDYMVPSHFVYLASLPLTHNGKIDRGALPAPDFTETARTHAFVAPRTDTEARLGAIWRDVLKMDALSVEDDVFDLGATSLMVVAAAAQVEASFGIALQFRTIFENPTVGALAAAIDRRGSAHANGSATPSAPTPPPEPLSSRPAPVVTSHVEVMRFGPAERELLGLYHRPSAQTDKATACILCNPFGQEAMRSHRVFRTLAERLSAGGLHVLRFDYFGTGDSPGEDEAGDIDGWITDLLRAHVTLLERSNCTRCVWLGLRLGATLAALAAVRARRVPYRLVLWEPVIDGAAYLDELAEAHLAFRRVQFRRRWDVEHELETRAMAEARTEVLGHPLPPLLRSQLGKISMETFAQSVGRNMSLIAGRPDGGTAKLASFLERAGAHVRLRITASNIDWLVNDMLGVSIVPADDVRSMADEAAEA